MKKANIRRGPFNKSATKFFLAMEDGLLLLLSYFTTFSISVPTLIPPISNQQPPSISSLNDEIDFEILPYIRFYKSGRFERLFSPPFLPPSSGDSVTGVASKDVIIDSATPISARLYLPPTTLSKLPLVLYFHGGAFCIESAFSAPYHSYLNSLAALAGVIIVSAEYRLAPEYTLPAAYDDCWAVLQWAVAGSDPWIAEHSDMNKLFLAGDSAGANIAHRMAIRAGAEGRMRVEGIAAVHPYFSTGAEKLGTFGDKMWRMVCPGAIGGTADPRMYPAAEKKAVKGMAGRRLVVFVAGKDGLREAGKEYYEVVKESGWGGVVKLVETKEEGHVFHLKKPESKNARELMKTLAEFLNAE